MTCENCGAKTELYLCGHCTAELRDMLHGLVYGQDLPNQHQGAGFIEYLEDARFGRTRLGESARKSTEYSRPALAKLTDDDKDSFKGSPSELFTRIQNILLTWTHKLLAQGADPR